jgi:hypothetical protein
MVDAIGSCALDGAGLQAQGARYRALGAHALAVERDPARLVVRFGAGVDVALAEEAVRIERGGCPLVALEWDARARTLTAAVADPAHRPALDALADALSGS